jgi:uncharacterized damage-inducible protein DinB
MLAMIRDLFAHQAWADAEMWQFIAAAPAAQSDQKVLELLNHIHAVQRYFLSAVQGEPLTVEELQKKIPLPELRESFRQYHDLCGRFLPKMRESHLNDPVVVPWFPHFQPRVSEALTQIVMHTQHHRAQISTLLRQLGGDPKPVDYIVWTAKDRPAPRWEQAVSA